MNSSSYFWDMEQIVNRVKESGLITIDLADFKPRARLEGLDIADQLWQGLVLKEKDFRGWLKEHDWSGYGGAVYVHCSADAIVPTWAYMLVASKLCEHDVPFVIGSELDLYKMLIRRSIEAQDLSGFEDGRVIIKGCADIQAPEFAMSEMIRVLQPVTKSIMYGEPCSTVPVFKRK